MFKSDPIFFFKYPIYNFFFYFVTRYFPFNIYFSTGVSSNPYY